MALKWSDLIILTAGIGLLGVGFNRQLPGLTHAMVGPPITTVAIEPPPVVPPPPLPEQRAVEVIRPTVQYPTVGAPPPPSQAQAEPARPRLPQVPGLPQVPRLPQVIVPNGGGPNGGAVEPAQPQPGYVVSTLPNVIRPTDRTGPAGSSGTGFFISPDGSVMTVAHVVKDCRTIQIASRYLKSTPAQLLAFDAANDVALIRAPRVRPPALLAFSPKPSGTARLAIYGYPGDGDTLIPTETRGVLRTDRPNYAGADKRDLLWMDAAAVRAGFSGGPVLGPDGDVIGVINGHVTQRLTFKGGGTSDTKYVFGANTRTINSFLNREAPGLALDDSRSTGAGDVDKAVVHVFCWH